MANTEGARETHPHVTVKYGIHTNDVKPIEELLSLESAVVVKLDIIDKFDCDDYDVIIIKIISEQLEKLNRLISKNFDCTDTFPVYKPHATIAYVKKGSCDNLVGREDFKDLEFELDKIQFSPAIGDRFNIRLKKEDCLCELKAFS